MLLKLLFYSETLISELIATFRKETIRKEEGKIFSENKNQIKKNENNTIIPMAISNFNQDF